MKDIHIKYYVIVAIIIIVFTYFIANRAGRLKYEAKTKDERFTDTEKEKLNVTESEINFTRLTYDKAYYDSLANKINKAFGLINDNEQAIYDVFSKLKNIDDLKYLILRYDKRGISEFSIISLIKKYNLHDSLYLRLNEQEINKINNILLENNIQYTF